MKNGVYEDETIEFWLGKPHQHLAQVAAVLHKSRRDWEKKAFEGEIQAVRKTLAACFIQGSGIEVGAGTRPFPIPKEATCFYGDIRDKNQLEAYFKDNSFPTSENVDAQTLLGVADRSLDFIISAHVIEHLLNPIGAIRNSFRVLRSGGIFILIVPDMRHTWDKPRPLTTLEHLIGDEKDGGESTRKQSYSEHVEYLNPQFDLEDPPTVESMMESKAETHFHTWTTESFREMLHYICKETPFSIETESFVVNENSFVLKKY